MLSTSEAARAMGSVRSPAKAAAAQENGKRGGRPLKPLSEIACNCGADGAAPSGEGLDHKSTCMRGRAIRRRLARAGTSRKEGLPLE